ncbi:MAG: hypothetical protein ACJ72Z_05075 [Pyrinomonadaceae bacterium]
MNFTFTLFFIVCLEKEKNSGKAEYENQDHHRGDEDHLGSSGTGHIWKNK